MTENYNIEKAYNLARLVQEYEQERQLVDYRNAYERKAILDALALEGQIKSQDALLEADEEKYINDCKMFKYFRKIHAKMVEDYKIFDLAANFDTHHIQRTMPKSRTYPISTKHQLKQVVYGFNAQHRK